MIGHIFSKIKNCVSGVEFELLPLTPIKLKQSAEYAAKSFSNTYNTKLDFTPESLKRLEEIIENHRQELYNERSQLMIGLGSYLGEVLARNLEGKWIINEEINKLEGDNLDSQIQLLSGLQDKVKMKVGPTEVSPFGKAYKRINDGKQDSLDSYYEMLEKIASQNK